MEQRPKKLLDQVRESIRRSTILFTLSKLMPLGSGVASFYTTNSMRTIIDKKRFRVRHAY